MIAEPDGSPVSCAAQIWRGKAYPLGATYYGSGTNFALFSEAAERVELCLFDENGAEDRITLPDVDPFVVLDPYSKAIDGSFDWNQSLFGYNFGDPDSRNDDDSAASMPKSVVVSPFFDWGVDRPPQHQYAQSVIYEAHVKGLTADAPLRCICVRLSATYRIAAHQQHCHAGSRPLLVGMAVSDNRAMRRRVSDKAPGWRQSRAA